jgi:HAD superfamily hydrolase (TIGR01484 family)
MITGGNVYVFDLDGTLCISKQELPYPIREALTQLAASNRVAILTGGTLTQIQTQVLDLLPDVELWAYGCSGTQYQQPNQPPVYTAIPATDRQRIIAVVKKKTKELGYWCEQPMGDIIEDRVSQVTFSALGQHANLQHKLKWDTDGSKRQRIIEAITPHLNGYTAHLGGSTSIDITHPKQTKQHGIELIAEHLNVPVSSITFIGDDLQPGGNDYPVTLTAAKTIPTRNWLQTLTLIKQFNEQIP